MDYMSRNADRRADPSKLLEGARSIISVLYNYYPTSEQQASSFYKISKYAYGTDYHQIIKAKLFQIIEYLDYLDPQSRSMAFVDTAPILEKAWAEQAGIGWIGKNTCLINKNAGSFFFIGEIVSTMELSYDTPERNRCGTCRKCIDACPTGALVKPYILDSRKCISYLTIEKKDEIDYKSPGAFNNYIFGCDICQEVCPWNRFSRPHREADFKLPEEIRKMKKSDWENLTEKHFYDLFKNTAMKRTGYKRLKRNIEFVSNRNSKQQ